MAGSSRAEANGDEVICESVDVDFGVDRSVVRSGVHLAGRGVELRGNVLSAPPTRLRGRCTRGGWREVRPRVRPGCAPEGSVASPGAEVTELMYRYEQPNPRWLVRVQSSFFVFEPHHRIAPTRRVVTGSPGGPGRCSTWENLAAQHIRLTLESRATTVRIIARGGDQSRCQGVKNSSNVPYVHICESRA